MAAHDTQDTHDWATARRFRAALALIGQTQREWARAHGTDGNHLHRVLAGRRAGSALIRAAIAGTIERAGVAHLEVPR
jgi:hypothetical protein